MAELNIWLILTIVLIVFASDYYLTVYGNYLYSEYGSQHFQYETSYELNPVMKQDVDNFRLLSPIFIGHLICVLLSFVFFRYFTTTLIDSPDSFDFFAGMFLLLEVPILLRHFRNIISYNPKNIALVHGHIKYSDKYTLILTAQDYFGFSIIFLVVFLLTGKFFFFGGLFICVWRCLIMVQQSRRLG